MNKKLFFAVEYKYLVAAIYACVLFLDRLDLTIVNITLPTLATYFKIPITQTEWITNGFLLALAIGIPISGWAADRFGTKNIFILATSIFGLASLLCAYAPNVIIMVLLRFVQGIGGGMIIPVGMTMVYRAFEVSEYASITSFVFIPTLVAPAIAPALGGAIIHFVNWQWVFIFAAPICLIAVLLSIFILKEGKIDDTPTLDWGGFLLSTIALVFILYSLSSLGKNGFSFITIISIIIAILFSIFFISYEKHQLAPLININFFKNKLFLQANLIQIAFQICHFGSIFLIGMYLQIGVGMSALISGLIMGMQALGAICTSRYSVKLYYQYGPGLPIIIGFIGVAIFTISILMIRNAQAVILGCVILFIRGIFSGLCGTPIQTASVVGFNKFEVGRASAVFNAGRQVAISLGVALSSLLIAYGFKIHHANLSQTKALGYMSAFYYAFAMIPLIACLGIFITSKMNNKEILLLSEERA